MVQLNTEILKLKSDLMVMWNLVISQLSKTREAIDNADCDLVNEIKANEKKVDAFELKIDMDCENILALYSPVANDLRIILAVLKINYNLERIGDYAHSIAKLVGTNAFSKGSLKKTEMQDMFELSIKMLSDALESFEKDDIHKLQKIFKKDEKLDKTNKNANAIIGELIKKHPDDIHNLLNLLTIIRRLERVGDQTKNIGEEIIFYVEAKVLRHQKKKDIS